MNKRKNIIITLLVILLITSWTITYLSLNGTINLKLDSNKESKEDKKEEKDPSTDIESNLMKVNLLEMKN